MAKSVLHVVPHENTWAVKREGNERASSTHPTQKEAIESARELAKELDDIVIHRADGTIRERVTYYGSNGQATGEAAATTTTTTTSAAKVVDDWRVDLKPEDVAGVAPRVSWEAVLAGAFVALAAYITLTLFAIALGLTVSDQMWGRGFTVAAAAISGLILLLSLFLGGYVASATTAGEQPREAGIYGVMVWGTVVVILLTGGLSFGMGHLSGLRTMAATNPNLRSEQMKAELGLSPEQTQAYARLTGETPPAVEVNPTRAAWWAFGAVALSLLASIVGGWLGSGPEFVLRRADGGTPATVAALPRTA